MTAKISVSPAAYERLRTHLLQSDVEQVAFAFADTHLQNGELVFELVELVLLEPGDYLSQYSYHVGLTDEAQQRIIKGAWDRSMSLVEFHSHRFSKWPAEFSPSDLAGLSEWVRHVRWRLQGRPYAAVVMTDATLDALCWQESNEPKLLSHVDVGGTIIKSTGVTIRRIGGPYDRESI